MPVSGDDVQIAGLGSLQVNAFEVAVNVVNGTVRQRGFEFVDGDREHVRLLTCM